VSSSFIVAVINTIIIVCLVRSKGIVNCLLEVNISHFRLGHGKWENVIKCCKPAFSEH